MAKINFALSVYSQTENFLSFLIFFASWETVDLGKSKHADFNGPPFQRKKNLKFTPHWPPGVLWGPLRGPSSEKFWGNFIWCERPLIVEPISIEKPFVAISSRLNLILSFFDPSITLRPWAFAHRTIVTFLTHYVLCSRVQCTLLCLSALVGLSVGRENGFFTSVAFSRKVLSLFLPLTPCPRRAPARSHAMDSAVYLGFLP